MSLSSLLWTFCGHYLPWGLIALACHFITSAIYNLFFSPLAKYPGPIFSKISTLPSFYHAIKGDRHIWVWQCFQTYGNKFRVYPNGILFNSPKAYSDIYSLKANVQKCRGYEAWKRNEQDVNTLTEVDVKLQAKRRRLLNLVFTERSIRSACDFVIKHVDRWNDLLIEGNGRDWSSPLDVNVSCNGMTLDLLGDLCFGRSFDIKERDASPFKTVPSSIIAYMRFTYPMSKFPLLGLLLWIKPRGLNQLLEMIAPKDVKMWVNFVADSVASRIELEKELQCRATDEEMRRDMFHYLFQAKDPETGDPAFSERDLIAEANLFLVAGSDSTSAALCSLFFYIIHNAAVYSKLVAEIRTTFATVEDIVSGPQLTTCQYTRACIDEALRLTPGPSELVRTVRHGGLVIDGEFVPEGIDVATSAWSSNRNDETYGDASVFRPERWIVDEKTGTTAEDVTRVRASFHPFSAGPDNCVGKNLAIMELMVTVARTLFRLDVRQMPGSTVGEGTPELGWGRDDRSQYVVGDAFIPLRSGPMVQFRRRQS